MQHKLAIGVTVLGAVIIIVVGILGWSVIPDFIDKKIKEEVQLKNGSEVWEKWQDIPFPIYLKFYVFHITNPEEVIGGEQPKFLQRGPYAYLQNRTKEEITHNDSSNPLNTVQYKEKKTYFFDQELSGNNSEEDLVNVINIPFVAVIHGIRSMAPVLAPIIANWNLKGEEFVRQNVKVRELLFDGFDVTKYTNDPLLGPLLPKEFSNGTFGLYKGENGTLSLPYDIYTGKDDHTMFGTIRTYNGDDDLHFWQNGTFCDKVRGGDGSLFPPFMTKKTEFYVFSNDLCRSLRFSYDSEQKFKGVKVLRFRVPQWELADPRINTENQCYCLTPTLDECPKAGAMSMEGCRDGAPIMMSTPYFLDGDEGYRQDVGLAEPVVDQHMTFLDIQPDSGVLLRGHKRIQVNLDVKIGFGVDAYKDLKKDVVFPLLWADESAEIDDETVDELKSSLLKPLKIVDITKWTLIGVGIAIVLSGGIIFYIRRRKSKETV